MNASQNNEPIRLGLLGCGTVGTGVLNILRDNAADIEARLGTGLSVTRIAVSDMTKPRDSIVERHLLTTDPKQVTQDPDVQIVVEVMGGYEPARTLVRDALSHGKHVVTANKALLARHGTELFALADKQACDIIFEAAVGGGIPIIRALREGLASDHIETIHAIINGTSNYVLTAMAQAGTSYDEALRQAQDLGYAEADPTMDVSGLDAAQKLAILIGVAFGTEASFEAIGTQGIETLNPIDIRFARHFGYAIKHLAVAIAHAEGIEARVHPALVPQQSMLGNVHGVFNAVHVHSHALGPALFYGQGAGMMPTAAAVVSDTIELARNVQRGTSGRLPHLAFQPDRVHQHALRDAKETFCPFYLRFTVKERPGVLATLTGLLSEHNISIRQMIQEDAVGEQPVQVVMLTHTAREGDLIEALDAIEATDATLTPPCYLRVTPLL